MSTAFWGPAGTLDFLLRHSTPLQHTSCRCTRSNKNKTLRETARRFVPAGQMLLMSLLSVIVSPRPCGRIIPRQSSLRFIAPLGVAKGKPMHCLLRTASRRLWLFVSWHNLCPTWHSRNGAE